MDGLDYYTVALELSKIIADSTINPNDYDLDQVALLLNKTKELFEESPEMSDRVGLVMLDMLKKQMGEESYEAYMKVLNEALDEELFNIVPAPDNYLTIVSNVMVKGTAFLMKFVEDK